MCCPFHGDKHPSMKVDSRFHCFACQADGDVIDFVGRLFQLSPYKAVEKLKNDCSVLPDPQTENELRKYWEGLHERLEKEERRLA